MIRAKNNNVMKTRKIDFGLKIRKSSSKSNIPKPKLFSKSNKLKNMNWNQVRKRFPRISPQGDIDFDGTRNKFDCKPFDSSRDGVFGKIKKKVKNVFKKDNPAAPKVRILIKQNIERVAGIKTGSSSQEKKYAGPGRPSGQYKLRIHPMTGKPIRIPALDYYALVKQAKKLREAKAQQVAIEKEKQLINRGLSPEQILALKAQKMREIASQQAQSQLQEESVPEVQEMPIESNEEVVYTQQPQYIEETIQEQPRYQIVRDIMTGRPIIKPIPQKERWTTE